jgi:hypothetical protein
VSAVRPERETSGKNTPGELPGPDPKRHEAGDEIRGFFARAEATVLMTPNKVCVSNGNMHFVSPDFKQQVCRQTTLSKWDVNLDLK